MTEGVFLPDGAFLPVPRLACRADALAKAGKVIYKTEHNAAFGSWPAGIRRRQQTFQDPIPADFTLNRPTRSGMLPPHEQANSYWFFVPLDRRAISFAL